MNVPQDPGSDSRPTANPQRSPDQQSQSPRGRLDSTWAYRNGNWIRQSDLAVSFRDLGFTMGATVVERLRTYAGRIWQPDRHLDRWCHSCEVIGMDARKNDVINAIDQIFEHNPIANLGEDVFLVLLGTPGVPTAGSITADSIVNPTIMAYLDSIPHSRIERRRKDGQPLVTTSVQIPDSSCWPQTAKLRSRLHYLRADQIAHRSGDPDAIGLLVDSGGAIADTSIACVVAETPEGLVFTPKGKLLEGITMSVCIEITIDLGIPFQRHRLSVEDLKSAKSVWLMGTGGGVWPVSSIDGETRDHRLADMLRVQEEFFRRANAK